MTALMEPPVHQDVATVDTKAPVSLRTLSVVPPRMKDSTRIWNPVSGEGLKEAEKFFTEKLAEGYTAYEVMEGGGGTVIRQFDPRADIHLMAPMAGG